MGMEDSDRKEGMQTYGRHEKEKKFGNNDGRFEIQHKQG